MTPGDDRQWHVLVFALGLGVVTLIALALYVQGANRVHDPLTERQLQSATFDPPPPARSTGETLAQVWSDLKGRAGHDFLEQLLPSQGATLWLAIIVALVVAFDTARPASAHNVELVGLLLVGVLLFDVMRFFDLLRDATYYRVMDWVFTAVVLVSGALASRAAWCARGVRPGDWRPNLPTRSLVLLTIVLLGLNALVTVVREPDDAGFYTNLGGQRLRERGMFSYGDPLLSGSPAAAYGPVLFIAHIPFQWIFDREPVNPPTFEPPLRQERPYRLPPPQATQLTTLAFHLLAVASLVVSARRLAGAQVAWALAALYCSSVYVMGIGGEREMIGGLTFISHTAPPALALLAFACLEWPAVAGFILALSIATVFYPLFFIPAWLGYYSRRRRALVRFVLGMALAAVVVGGPVMARSRALPGQSLLGTIVRETLGHHQGSDVYGQTPFGFWGHRGGVRGWLQTELVHGQAMTTPMFMLVLVVAALAFVPGQRATPQQLALLSGASAILVVTWKILGTGVYVTWYYPFLLLGFYAHGRPRDDLAVP